MKNARSVVFDNFPCAASRDDSCISMAERIPFVHASCIPGFILCVLAVWSGWQRTLPLPAAGAMFLQATRDDCLNDQFLCSVGGRFFAPA